jgi:hypothetical protein
MDLWQKFIGKIQDEVTKRAQTASNAILTFELVVGSDMHTFIAPYEKLQCIASTCTSISWSTPTIGVLNCSGT